MLSVKPAPVIKTAGSTSIRIALQMMIELNSSYVIVVDDQNNMLGIFTDKDALQRFFDLQSAASLDKPIATIATRPVYSVSADLIHTAPDLMLKHNIRHIPIVAKNDKGAQRIVGMLTQETIFQGMVRKHSMPQILGQPKLGKPIKLGVVAPEETTYRTLEQLFKASTLVEVHRYWLSDLQSEPQIIAAAKKFDTIIMDIDGAPENKWKQVLKLFNNHPDLEHVCVLLDSNQHSSETVELIERLRGVGWLHVYIKPIDLAVFVHDLQEIWR